MATKIPKRVHVWSREHGKEKDTAMDFAVPTGGVDLRFIVHQPGSAMGSLGVGHPVLLRTLPVYHPQISSCTHLGLCRL